VAKEDRDITRIIHYLCLMLDEMDEKIANKAVAPIPHLEELQEKAKYLMLSAKLLQDDQDENLKNYKPPEHDDEPKGYSWEEVLEEVKGRRKDLEDNQSQDT